MILNLYTIRYTVFLFISVLLTFIYATEDSNFELKLLNVIFRHGDRTPDKNGNELYPNDPYLNYSFYPYGKGQLTKNGMQREFKLGQFLRKRYDNYFGSIYLPNIIEAQSTDYDRTKASLQLVLAGLFPTEGIQIWNPKLRWQPIPSKYIPRDHDDLLLRDECPGFLYEYKKVLESPEFKKEFAPYEDLTVELTKFTGKKIVNLLDITYLFHTLTAEYFMNLPLPAWTKPLFPYGKLYNATLLSYKASNYNKSQRRQYGGALLQEFIKNMIGYVNGTLKAGNKMFLYSGHETNIASLLYSLNVYKPHTPAYSSSIFMELLYKEGIYYVKILYYLGIPPELKVLRLPGCEEICPLDKFFQLTIDDIPLDEEIICNRTITPVNEDQEFPESGADIYHYIQNYINN